MAEKYSSKENIPRNEEPNLWDLLSAPDPGSAKVDIPSSSEREYKSHEQQFKELAAMHFGTKEDTPIYDLSGRAVVAPRRGIYIQGGRKVVR